MVLTIFYLNRFQIQNSVLSCGYAVITSNDISKGKKREVQRR